MEMNTPNPHRIRSAISVRKSFLTAAALVMIAAVAAGQEGGGEPLETDRDSFTPATTVAGGGRLILESAYSFIDNRDAAESHSFPELLARYGVGEWLELRIGANYEVGGDSSGVSGSSGNIGDLEPGEIESEAKVFYGFKAALNDQNGWLPRTAVVVHGNTPTSGPETETTAVATYVWGWTLVEGVEWDTAMRYANGVAEQDHFNRWAPSTVLKLEVAERTKAHLEYFGIYTDDRDVELSESYVSPGVHYLVTPDLEVGIRVGWGVSDDAANFFSNIGIGLRF
jgi:hypothetical protein